MRPLYRRCVQIMFAFTDTARLFTDHPGPAAYQEYDILAGNISFAENDLYDRGAKRVFFMAAGPGSAAEKEKGKPPAPPEAPRRARPQGQELDRGRDHSCGGALAADGAGCAAAGVVVYLAGRPDCPWPIHRARIGFP